MDELKKNPEKPDKTDQPVTDNPISPIIVKSEDKDLFKIGDLSGLLDLPNALFNKNYRNSDRTAEIRVKSELLNSHLVEFLYLRFKKVTLAKEDDDFIKICIVFDQNSEKILYEFIAGLKAAIVAKTKENLELA